MYEKEKAQVLDDVCVWLYAKIYQLKLAQAVHGHDNLKEIQAHAYVLHRAMLMASEIERGVKRE